MNNEKNLLMCVGFKGKMAVSNNTKFKIKVDVVVELMGNKRIKLIKPIKIHPEEYPGLEWNLEKLNKPKVYTPESHVMYKSRKGETSIRFREYNYTRHTDEYDNEETER